MSGSPESPALVTYEIDARSPVVEIYLLDGCFNVQAQGLGVLRGAAPPGLYKVKFKSGGAFVEKLLELAPPSTQFALDPREMSFATPVPIEGSVSSHEFHRAPAEELSRQTHTKFGSGGGYLFVFVRDQKKDFTSNPAESLRLLDSNEKLLARLAEIGLSDTPQSKESWHGCNIELNPGTYILECDLGERKLRQSIVICPGWQTQVFLFRSAANGGPAARPDLAGAGILMVRSGQGFTSTAFEHLQWSEMARNSLAQRKAFDSPKDPVIREMISGKFEDPMLGIYAAHCLLMRADPDRDLLQAMVGNLEGLLGRHPDVDSVKLALTAAPGEMHWDLPPMLRSSWSTVVTASYDHPEVVPQGSLAARAASRTWGGGAWFIWQADTERSAERTVGTRPTPVFTPSETAVYEYVLNRTDADAFAQKLRGKRTAVQKKAPRVISDGAQTLLAKAASKKRNLEVQLTRFSATDLAKSLGLPSSTIHAALAGLSQKLKK